MSQVSHRFSPQSQLVTRDDATIQSEKPHIVQAPALTLPTGGGAIRGIDEKFQVNASTGSGSMTIPIVTSPARQGFGPQLSLNYNSGSGSDSFGLGWSLTLPRITRKTDKGLPSYQDAQESDVFVLSGAEDLVPVLEDNGGALTRHVQSRIWDGTSYLVQRYRPRVEGSFARIEQWINQQTRESHWRSITPDNVTTLYGQTTESRIADPNDPLRIFSWLICESYDDKGNAIVYRYKAEDSVNVDDSQVHERNRTAHSRSAQRYLKRIFYGNLTPHQPGEHLHDRTDWLFEIVCDYDEGHVQRLEADDEGRQFVSSTIEASQPWSVRQDPISSHRAGFEVRTYRLCRRILMVHHFPNELGVDDYLVRATHFGYVESPRHTVMTSVVQSGYLRQDDGSYQEHSLPPVEFEYSQAEIQSEVHDIDPDSLENLPVGLSGGLYHWVDLDGEGLNGILTEQGEGWFYKPNLGNGRFGAQEQVAAKPSLAALTRGQQLLDVAGNGQLALVTLDGPTPGFYERTQDQSWTDHQAFSSVPSIAWNDPNLRFVDLTGDGQADVMVTEDQVFTWYPSLAAEGYGASRSVPQADDDEVGPRLLFADVTESIYLADMSGDGLTDLVRIRNGEVCYWPHLGYGCFGAKINMDHAPWFDAPDLFDQQRIRLADVDGSGAASLLYIHHDCVAIYFNQAGNGWSQAEIIHHFPGADNLSGVTVTDLLGTGVACLVWSSPLPGDTHARMRYIDLMGGQKPHLMIASRNHLGAETRVHYAPSTQFYLDDQAAGRPWVTRLPFPVHVVERTETYDHISRNRFVTRYRYHHGYYDGREREFRGFGMVEQIDTEAFAALNQSADFPIGANIDATSHMPPVLTRTWFHTGAYVGSSRISRLMQDEYYREPGLSDEDAQRQLLPDTVLPSGLTTEAEREAARALKGAMLRQEVYALDDSDRRDHPYVVSEQNFTIEPLQPHGPNRHAVFFTHARESISYHYERQLADPRVGYQGVLATDAFGNVLQAVEIGYGRRQADASLLPEDQNRQGQLLMTYTESDLTHAIEEDDTYRAPLPCGVRTYEVTGLELAVEQSRFSFRQLQEAVAAATEIAYHTAPTPGVLQKRVLEQVHTLYRRDDLNGPLPLGEIESLALPFEMYQLAVTPEHLELVFGVGQVTDAMMSDEGYYVHINGDANWWIPSGRTLLSPNVADSPSEELTFAQQHFFTPVRFRDPFGQTATVAYDPYDLLVVSTRDPLANQVTAEYDYRLLAPERLTDPNGNRSQAAFDILGLVAGTAMMGKASETVGDTLDAFQARLTQGQIDAFFADPRGPIATELLGSATSRIIYDETRF